MGANISVITLNLIGLNISTKRHKQVEWIPKQDLYICCLQKIHIRHRDTNRLQVRGWKKIFHADGNQNTAGAAILMSDKIDLKIKNIIRDQEGHYKIIKGSIQEENITIVNIHAPNTGAPQNIRQTLTDIKGETYKNTVIRGTLTAHSPQWTD